MQMKARYGVCYALFLTKHFTQAIDFGFHENFERSTFAFVFVMENNLICFFFFLCFLKAKGSATSMVYYSRPKNNGKVMSSKCFKNVNINNQIYSRLILI